jgi:hypothetical protein
MAQLLSPPQKFPEADAPKQPQRKRFPRFLIPHRSLIWITQ